MQQAGRPCVVQARRLFFFCMHCNRVLLVYQDQLVLQDHEVARDRKDEKDQLVNMEPQDQK